MSLAKKKIFILESSVIGPKYIHAACQELGLEPIFLTSINNQEGDALKELMSYTFIQTNTQSVEDIIHVIGSFPINEIAGLITFLDSRLEIVASVCKKLEIKGVSKEILTIKSKADVARLAQDFTPNSININARSFNADLVKDFFTQYKKVAVKPVFGAGGKGFRVYSDLNRLLEDNLEDQSLSSSLKPNELIIEEFVEGELVSLEGYVVNGKVKIYGLTGRRKIKNSETLFIFPYNENVSRDNFKRMEDAVKHLIDAADIQNMSFHSEFIVSKSNALLIDANFGRPGGANIIEVMASAYNLPPMKFFKNSISLLIFGREIDEVKVLSDPQPAIGLAYGLKARARVLAIDKGFETDGACYHVVAQNMGYELEALGESNWSWLGLIAGPPAAVRNKISKIMICTDQGLKKPYYSEIPLL